MSHDMHHGGDHSGHDMPVDHMGHDMHQEHVTSTTPGHLEHHTTTGHGGGHGGGHEGEHGSEHGGGHGMMMMFFHFGFTETILFECWSINTVGGLIGSMIGIFFMAALYEGLKYYREYLFWRTYNALQYRAVNIPPTKNGTEDNQIVHMVGGVIHKQPPTMMSPMHFFQTFLHMVQMVVSYFLMLIFMTYNVWLCAAVVLGAATGYFLFGWKKSVIVDVTEHCH